MCCIAPVLAAKCLPNAQITVGMRQNESGEWPFAGTIDACGQLGAQCSSKDVTQTQVDANYKLVTTPAFMKSSATYAEVFDGIGLMVNCLLKLIK
jgi:enhancing lycopene biosynthesis protein 2